MALGVSLLFLGFVGVLVFILALGILFAGWWPGGRPPAWEAGEAIPWQRPGEQAPDTGASETIEGSAEPVEPQSAEPKSRPPPRKRKRRRNG